tara:strand:+ start:626 stop:1528 length:903 start_codon:yes stop_codon:yes gene_type:complete
MIKILVPIMLSIVMIGCNSEKEPPTVVQKETTEKSSELTKLDRCLLKVGMQDGSTTSDMSIPDVIERELNKMDVATLKGSDYNGYDHECIDDYIEYVKGVSGNYVADYSDLGGFGSEFVDDIAHDDNREFNICLAHAGIDRANSDYKTFEIEESLMSMAANEMMAIDRDTGMGAYLDDFKHECLDLYVNYINNNEYSDVSEESLEFDVSVAPVLYKTYENERYQTQITIISKNDNPITLTDIIINRGNAKNCAPYGPTSNLNKTMNFGQKVTVMLWYTCEVSDIIEIGINTTSGDLVYNF